MSDKKPLIFVHPLSKTLLQLKEVIEENADADNIEVFEVESLNEMNQLIPTIGPSLTIISNPRKCAMFLQANHRLITRAKAKVIMLSPKFIPRKTLEKFMKIALTDCITEPVAPKTLLYKVKLMLRSLPSTLNDKQDDIIVSSEDDEKLGNEDTQHVEKGIKMEGHLKGSVSNENELKLQLEGEEEQGIHTSSEAEQKNDGHLRGDISDSEEDKGGNQEAEGYKENPISSHYKGSVEQGLNLEPEVEEEDYASDLDKDSLLEQARDELNLSLTEEEPDDLYEDKKEEEDKLSPELETSVSLELEKEKEKKAKMESDNHLAGHLKGKVDNTKLEMEEEEITEEKEVEPKEKGKSPFDNLTPNLDLEDGNNDMTLEKEEEIKGVMNDKIDSTLNLEDEESNNETQLGTDQLDGDLSGEGEKADELDKYYRSDLNKGLQLQDEDKESSFDTNDDDKGKIGQKEEELSLKLVDEPGVKKLKEDDSATTLELKSDLQLEDDENNLLALDGKLNKKVKEQDPNLNLELEEFKDQKKRKAELAKKNAKGLMQKKDLGFKDEDAEIDWKKDDIKSELKKKNVDVELNLEEEEKEKKIQNHGVDHIQKYYGMKGGDEIKKGADWNGLNKKEEVWETQEKIVDGEERELIIPKVDRGEQTIDYSKLKAGFDISITTDRERSKSAGSIDWNTKKKKEIAKGPKLDNPDQDLFEEALTEEEEEIIAQKEPIFEPDSRGLEHVIEIMSLYHDNKKDLFTILFDISHKIYEQTKGLTTFFLYNQQTESYKEEFSGHLFIDTSIEKQLRENRWELLKKGRLDTWKLSSLPIWKDTTFQEDENEFLYPYYRGVSNMGFAVISFNNQIEEKESHQIEIILESARGGYLDNHSTIEEIMRKKEEQKSNKKSTKKEKKGVLGGFFRKKKAS